MAYSIRNKSIIGAQRIFETLCEDIKSGKYKNPIEDGKGNPIPIEVTPENFKMAYGKLDEEDPLYVCRQQLPRYWFVSREGIIISLWNNTPVWYKGNTPGRTDSEIQIKINSSQNGKHKFKQRNKDGKEKPVTIYNYTLVAIVYNSILIGEPEDIENVKKYGLEVFGIKNSGGSSNNKNKPLEDIIKGARGLVIDGKEVIPPENMMDVHHTEGKEHLSPEQLEIMPHWLHQYLKYYTATIETAEELGRLIKKDPIACARIDRMCPKGYIIIDYSKTITKEGIANRYIYYRGINQPRENQVSANKYKYFKIVPFSRRYHVVVFDLSDSALEASERPVIQAIFNTDTGSQKLFFLSYISGSKDGFRRIIEKSCREPNYLDPIGNAFDKICRNREETKKKLVEQGKNKEAERIQTDIMTYYAENYDCTVVLIKAVGLQAEKKPEAEDE